MQRLADHICREIDLRMLKTECLKHSRARRERDKTAKECRIVIKDGAAWMPEHCTHECRQEMILYVAGFFRQ